MALPIFHSNRFDCPSTISSETGIKKLQQFPSQIKIIDTRSRSSNFHDGINNSNTKLLTDQVTSAFTPHHLILLFLGRFPFLLRVPSAKWNLLESFFWIYFLLTTLALFLILIATTLGFTDYFLYWKIVDESVEHEKELDLFQRNIVPFVLFWGCLVHATVGNVSFIRNRRNLVQYFQEWNQAVNVLKLELPFSLRRFLICSNIGVFIFVMVVIMFYLWECIETVRGISDLVILLLFRYVYPAAVQERTRTVGLFISIYVIYSSRALIFIFTFNCRLLKYCFKSWNQRFQQHLMQDGSEHSESEIRIPMEKHSCSKIFSDHCTLITMVKKTDRVFAGTLQSYYLTQALNMCFELYFLAKSGSSHTNASLGDVLVPFILIFQTFFIFFTVSLEGVYVNEEAMKGFQLLRRHRLDESDSPNKKYLMHNLSVSFSQNIVLSGGKYFSVDRPFIIRVLGAVFTYFVIILQYGTNITGGSECPATGNSANPKTCFENSAFGEIFG